MRMLGLYAVDPDEGEILYAVTREISGNCYLPAYNGTTLSGVNIQLVTTVGNSENISLETDPAAVATLKTVKERLSAFVELSENETPKENTRVHLLIVDKIINWFRANKADGPEGAHLLLDSGLTVEASAQPDSGDVIPLCIIHENSGE